MWNNYWVAVCLSISFQKHNQSCYSADVSDSADFGFNEAKYLNLFFRGDGCKKAYRNIEF